MSWVRLDDAMGDHRKVKRALRASRPAIALHFLGIVHCARYLTDGFVESEYVDEVLPLARERTAALDTLEAHDLWQPTDGGHMIHDYLDYNPTRAKVLALRAADADRKARGRERDSSGSPEGFQTDSDRIPAGVQAESDRPIPSHPIPDPEELQLPVLDPSIAILERDGIFAAWLLATERNPNTTHYSAPRKKTIKAALKSHGYDDCLMAVENIGRSTEARTGYGRGTRFDDISHALGNAERIEKWRDWKPPQALTVVNGSGGVAADRQARFEERAAAAARAYGGHTT